MNHSLNQTPLILKSVSHNNLHSKINQSYGLASANESHLNFLRNNNPFTRNINRLAIEFQNPIRNTELATKKQPKILSGRNIDNSSRLAHARSENDIHALKSYPSKYDQNLYTFNKKNYLNNHSPSLNYDYYDIPKSPYQNSNPFFTRANLTERIQTQNTSYLNGSLQENSVQHSSYCQRNHFQPYSKMIKQLDKDLIRRQLEYQKQLNILKDYGPEALRYHPHYVKPFDNFTQNYPHKSFDSSGLVSIDTNNRKQNGNPQLNAYLNQNNAKKTQQNFQQQRFLRNGQSRQTVSSKSRKDLKNQIPSKNQVQSRSFIEVDYEDQQQEDYKPSVIKFDEIDQSNALSDRNHNQNYFSSNQFQQNRLPSNQQLKNRTSQQTPGFEWDWDLYGSNEGVKQKLLIKTEYSNGKHMPFQSSSPQEQFGTFPDQVQQQQDDEDYQMQSKTTFKIIKRLQTKIQTDYSHIKPQITPESVQIKGKLYHLIKNRNQ